MEANWVSSGFRTIQWSPNGTSWIDGSGAFLDGNGVANDGKGTWVAVGDDTGSQIKWSSDGKYWNDASGASWTTEGKGVAYNNGKWVAVGRGTGSQIFWSSDGKSWHDASENGGGGYYGVAYGQNKWIAVGNGVISLSNDGKSWNNVSGIPNEVIGGIAYNGNGKWVAVGEAKTVLWSPDGLTWYDASGVFNNDLFGNDYYGVAYGNDTWVAVGEKGGLNNSNTIIWSPDGEAWYDASGDFGNYRGVAYNGEIFIVVGSITIGSDAHNILWSSDGKQWNDANGTINNIYNGVASRQSALPCFLKGTRILTPTGYMRVEDIETGGHILTSNGMKVKATVYTFSTVTNTETAPYCIPAGALGNYLPSRDLHISGNHAIQDAYGFWQIPRYLAQTNQEIQQHTIGKYVTYYHIECPNYIKDNLIAEGVIAESFNAKMKVQWKRTETGYVRKLPLQKGWWNIRKV